LKLAGIFSLKDTLKIKAKKIHKTIANLAGLNAIIHIKSIKRGGMK